MKVVLDSNILMSAFLAPKGEDANVLKQSKKQTLYLSPFILSEVWQVLHYPRIRKNYPFTENEINRHVAELTAACELVDTKLTLDVCSDPDDNQVLAAAIEASADYLVTRNIKHFPKTYKDVQIVHPKKILNKLNIIQS